MMSKSDSNTKSPIYVLLKFGKPEHIEAMYKMGELYFQDFKNWKAIDKYEGVCFIKNYEPNTILELFHKNETVKIKCSHLQELHSERNYGLANCFYVLNLNDYIEDEKFKTPQHMLIYGSSCLIIFNVEIFLKRCSDHFNSINIPLLCRRVEYGDLNLLVGKKQIFLKDLKFKEEQEYRIFLATTDLKTTIFHIGCLKDISSYIPDAANVGIKYARPSFYPDIKITHFV